MSIPPEFNAVEHLQSVIRQWINRDVRDYFADVGGDDWDPDITSPRGSLRWACTHQDTDNLTMTQLRLQLFDRIRLQKSQVPYYGIPVASFQEQRKFKPQISLFFIEDLDDVEPGYAAVTGEISFRLMNHDSSSVTEAIAQQYGTRIRSTFGAANGLIWRKGKVMTTYTDWSKGYQLQLLVRSKAEGRSLVENVLDIQQDTPDWKHFNSNENEEPAEAYPTIPETDYIFGETRRTPRRRPIADVRFQYALLHLHGAPHPIVLYDRSFTFSNALVAI